jgi:hypothetical protein
VEPVLALKGSIKVAQGSVLYPNSSIELLYREKKEKKKKKKKKGKGKKKGNLTSCELDSN